MSLAWFRRLAFISLFFPALAHGADDLRIAVAANFVATLEKLIDNYPHADDARIVVASGSTGKLYAQIRNGAPYDLFLAADAARPAALEAAGAGVNGSRFSYALGRLVVWDGSGHALRTGSQQRPPYFDPAEVRFVAIAHPDLAPYGAAAQQVLELLGIWDALQGKLVRGENVTQAFHYVRTGNADVGFVALAQLAGLPQTEPGSRWLVPASMHKPIEQQALLIRDRPEARAFSEFLRSDAAREIIRRSGYALPESS